MASASAGGLKASLCMLPCCDIFDAWLMTCLCAQRTCAWLPYSPDTELGRGLLTGADVLCSIMLNILGEAESEEGMQRAHDVMARAYRARPLPVHCVMSPLNLG